MSLDRVKVFYRRSPLIQGLIVAAALTLLCLSVGRAWRLSTFDDAYITYRCAENFAHGHGLVFNPGEQVEASSNFLFAVLIGVALRLTEISADQAALLLNHLGLFFILLLLAWRTARQGIAGPFVLRWAGLLFTALHPGLWVYAHSGMETVFFAALLFAGFVAVVEHVERGYPAAVAGLLIGLAADVRMEAAAFAALSAVLIFMLNQPGRRWRPLLGLTAAFLAVFGPALAYRWLFFGYPFPNAYYVKVDGGSAQLAVRGFLYSVFWFIANPIAVIVPLAIRRLWPQPGPDKARALIGLSWIGGYVAYNCYVGGDYFSFGRFFIPVIPIVSWLMIEWWPQVGAAFQRPWPRLAALWPRLARWVLAVTLLATLLFPKNLFLYVAQQKVVRIWAAVGMKLRQAAPRDLTLYVVNAGAIPYFSGLVAHDSLGLTDPVIAHRKVRLGMGLAGHEKSDLTRIADLQPDLLFINFYPAGTDLGHLVASFFQIATQLRKQARGKPVNWNLAQLIQAHPELRYDLLANTFSLSLLVNRSNLKDYSPMVLPVAGWSALFLVRREVVDYVPALQPVTLPPRPLPAGVKFGAGGPGQLSTARTPVSGSGIR